MNGYCREFFSRPALSGDDRRSVARTEALDQLVHFTHRFTRADEFAKSGTTLELGGELARSLPHFDVGFGGLQNSAKFRIVHRLRDEVLGALLHRFNRQVDAGVGSNKNDGPI